MQKKLTVKLDERSHSRLCKIVEYRRIRRCLESLARTHVTRRELNTAYREMAREDVREAEELEWAEATVGDVADETR
jgi:hypothetical protein